jgi:ankyrin repeat protein
MSRKRMLLLTGLALMMLFLAGCGASSTSESQADSPAPELDTSLDEQLVKALSNEDPAELASLLEAGADPNAQSTPGRPVLFLATLRGNAAAVELLIEHGADVHAETVDGSILVKAVVEGQQEIVELLLIAGADILSTGIDWTPEDTSLHAAASGGYLDIAELLLANGADVNQLDAYGGTALMKAAGRGRPEIVTLLLENGADVEEQQGETSQFQYANWPAGSTALHFAVFGDHGGDNENFVEVLRILIEQGAILDVEDEGGQTPLDVAVPETKIWEMLLEAGAGA